jgi:hypothetical protein
MILLDFLNKNLYRKYPIKGSCDMLCSNGEIFPLDLIATIQLSTIYGYDNVRLTKVCVKPNFISATIVAGTTGLLLRTGK